MHGDKLEDDFNAWVSSYGRHELGLKVFHPDDEECWQVNISHEDFLVTTSTVAEVEMFFAKAAEEGFFFRSWHKTICDDRGHPVGEAIMFAYNG